MMALARRGGVVLAVLFTAACGKEQSILGSNSPGAAAIESLWWVALGSTGVLTLLVFGGLVHALRRALHASGQSSGQSPESVSRPALAGSGIGGREERFILLAGGLGPALFLLAFLTLSVRTGTEAAAPPEEPALTIEVVGHMFWWEVTYPAYGFTTANEIHIPAERVIDVRVTSADVIHSFWVPQISPGKIDMVPGRTNTIWMFAPHAGRFRGQCTEFCGIQHARMSMAVTAHAPDEFDAWIEERAEPRPPPADPEQLVGVAVFFEAGCAACHSIEGVRPRDPAGMAGPDLTDLASRETLGALTIPNDRAHLTAWILNPDEFKPGVRMPATPLDGVELEALVTYLETLE